jgi:hypothetical protein
MKKLLALILLGLFLFSTEAPLNNGFINAWYFPFFTWGGLISPTLATSYSTGQALAQPPEEKITISAKEIVERLARLEQGQRGLDKRIDGLDRSLNKRIDFLCNLVLVLLASILGLIGFTIWDRKTYLRPHKTALQILQRYADKEPKMAEILRNMGLL